MKTIQKHRVLVTGGPTRAYIDDVRYISNFSTGTLAYFICRELIKRGHQVSLVSGPCVQPFERLNLTRWYPVETTDEMHAAVLREAKRLQPKFAVFSAAVLDFEPRVRLKGKTSSTKSVWTLKLKPTPKIIESVAERFPEIHRIGFKLEWERPKTRKAIDLLGTALLAQKHLSALCLNFLPEISGNEHPAYLFAPGERSEKVNNKDRIAKWIASWIGRTGRE